MPWLWWFACAATVFGMVFSPVALSVGMMVLGLAALANRDQNWSATLAVLRTSTLFWGLAGLYLYLLLTVGQTYDWTYYLERLRIKLPLLLLPPAFLLYYEGNERIKSADRIFTAGLLLLLCLTLFAVLVNYGFHFAEYNDLVRRGQPLPVPRGNHIRFSLLVAVGVVLGGDLAWRTRRRGYLLPALFLFAGLHLLAVRSGLVVAYAGIVVLLLYRTLSTGNYRMLLAGLAVVLLLPVAAYLTVPTFRTKLQYMRYELLHRDASVDTAAYSDQGRLTSIRLGLDLWRERPLLGVGPGNLRAAMDERYATVLLAAEAKRPHNQFVSALTGGGVVGLAVTVFCFGLLIFGGGRWRDPVFTALFVMFLLSCLVENTLESSVGVSMFSFFILWAAYPPYRKPG